MSAADDTLSSQLAEQYGTDVASEVMAQSRSNLQLDQIPQVGYGGGKYEGSTSQSR